MISKKNIVKNIALYSFIFVLLMFLRRIYTLNDHLTIKDTLIKYGLTLLAGLFIEIYTRLIIRLFKLKDFFQINKFDIFYLLKTILIIGIILSAIPMGTVFSFIFIFILDDQITGSIIQIIIDYYVPFLICGVFCGIATFIYRKIKKIS